MKPFTLYLRVRYGECDAQKVVFNARYADYVDVATIYVLVDAKTLTKAPLPDDLRSAFADGAKGKVTDHAGFSESTRT